MKRRHCPTGKLKHFNEAWADIEASRLSDLFGSLYRSYKCTCGWWHTYDRSKRHRKQQQREPRNARRRRTKQGLPSPLQLLQQQQEAARENRREKQRRQRQRSWLALRTWEDDGGLCVWPRDDD